MGVEQGSWYFNSLYMLPQFYAYKIMTYETVLYWCVLTYWVSVLTGESHSRWSMFQCASLRGSPASSGETPVPGWDWSPQEDPTTVCCINSPGITIEHWEFTQRKGSLPADSHKQSPRSKYNRAAARAKDHRTADDHYLPSCQSVTTFT